MPQIPKIFLPYSKTQKQKDIISSIHFVNRKFDVKFSDLKDISFDFLKSSNFKCNVRTNGIWKWNVDIFESFNELEDEDLVNIPEEIMSKLNH